MRREGAVAKAAEETQKALASQSASSSIASPQIVSWMGGANVSPFVLTKVMGLSGDHLPILTVAADKDRVDIVRVVKDDALPAEQLTAMTAMAQTAWNGPNDSLGYNAYMAALRERMGVKLYPERIQDTQE